MVSLGCMCVHRVVFEFKGFVEWNWSRRGDCSRAGAGTVVRRACRWLRGRGYGP